MRSLFFTNLFMIEKNFLDTDGLTRYDSKIKGYIDDVIETSVIPLIPTDTLTLTATLTDGTVKTYTIYGEEVNA